jgi:hypothetical protein
LVVKEPPRAVRFFSSTVDSYLPYTCFVILKLIKLANSKKQVSEREDKLFLDQIDNLMEQNQEVDGDDDDSEEEDTGMGDVDLTNSGVSAY